MLTGSEGSCENRSRLLMLHIYDRAGWLAAPWAVANSLVIAFDTEMTTQLQAEVHHVAQEMFVGIGNWWRPVGIDRPGA